MAYAHGTWPIFLAPQNITTAKPKPDKPIFPFLNLPAELRLQIYSHILPKSVRISPARPNLERSMHPWALTFVSRAIRDEVLSVLYSNAVFHLGFHGAETGFLRLETMTEAYVSWIEQLDEALGALVKHLVIDFEVEVRKKTIGIKKTDDSREEESPRRLDEIAYFGYHGGWARFGSGQRKLRDEVGEWEVFWRTEEVRAAKKECLLGVLRAIDSQETVVGLGKEGIRGLVAAYRNYGMKNVALPSAGDDASKKGQRRGPTPSDILVEAYRPVRR
ncbi:MAG: hypothetical protein L6R38_009014 [Xanthoria sp. 2 TBL-2021]|nr:MAG: hypothetical protein L6R38_009014 [Xanthoria sp. 2 TBL-2021]